MLGVEGGDGAGAGGGDRLAVGRVDDVAGGEDAGQVGARGAAVDRDGALRGEVELAVHEVRARVGADRDEQAADVEGGLRAVDGVDEADAGDQLVAVDVRDLLFQRNSIFGFA